MVMVEKKNLLNQIIEYSLAQGIEIDDILDAWNTDKEVLVSHYLDVMNLRDDNITYKRICTI